MKPYTLTRRRALSVGASAFGLSLPKILAADSFRSGGTSTRAKSVIILYLNGGPSQLDMWDLKPNAPVEVRGTFRPISTTVPGTQICEHMPEMAKLAHKYTIVRSMTHDESEHLRAGYWVMTGGRLKRPITAFSGMERSDFPHIGAVVSRDLPSSGMPPFVVVPEFVSPRGVARPGQNAGFLGAKFDPYAVESDPNLPTFDPGPIVGSGATELSQLRSRRQLLDQLESHSGFGAQFGNAEINAYRETALDLVSSDATKKAFDLSTESEKTRQKYGRHIFGQSTLVARRLIEAGVRLVQVNFVRRDNGRGGQGYDSHSSPPNPPHLSWAKDELLPPTDKAFAGLIRDLDDRGLLDETLVVMMGEFGRTPKFNARGGRDHWPGCYSLVVAGGGTTAGAVYGESDDIAASPVSDPVTPDDMLATIYHQLGLDHRSLMYDLADRPHVLADGEPVSGILA